MKPFDDKVRMTKLELVPCTSLIQHFRLASPYLSYGVPLRNVHPAPCNSLSKFSLKNIGDYLHDKIQPYKFFSISASEH